MKRKGFTVAVAVSVALMVTLTQALRDTIRLPMDDLSLYDMRTWLANIAASIVGSAIAIAGYLMASRGRVTLSIYTILLPVLLFLSMLPVYAAVRYGVSSEWLYVCPNETEAYAAPLSVLASLVVLPLARTWRGL